jgi:hypothetical protein
MIMIGQSRRLAEPLRWTRAGKLGVAAVVALLVAAVLGVTVFALTGGTREARGCFEVTFPSTLGAAYLHACGARAREICATPGRYPEVTAGGQLAAACRRAGYPYGRPAGP